MRHRSFRLRVALLSTLLAGSALVGFSAVAWRLIYGAKVSRLDAKLENQIKRFARPLPLELQPSRVADLLRELNVDAESGMALQMLDAAGDRLYQSPNWADEFNRANLYPPRLTELPPPISSDRFSERTQSFEGGEDRRERSFDRPLPPPEIVPRLVTQRTATGSWRIGAVRFPDSQVAIAISLDAINQEMGAIRNIFLVAIPATLLLVAVGAWVLSGSALYPIRQLTSVMQQIRVTGLDQRVPLGNTDVEFVELIQVFNRMLERLKRSFMQASRFSADAAHELKTPLAILQGELELALQQADSGSAMPQRLSSLLDEVRRLSGIVRKLLLLSLADAGQMALHKVQMNLSDLLAVMVEDLELLAPHLTVQAEITPGLIVWADRDLLTQVLQNLISNAIKYNLPEGWVRIQTERQAGSIAITIANASKEMSKADCDRIFDRFYRGDPARTRKVEGIGLGLSLSREIVRAHQGELQLVATTGTQTSFRLMLPEHNCTVDLPPQ